MFNHFWRQQALISLRIDGALQPWTDELIKTLLEMAPLPPGVEITPANDVPPPRVSLTSTSQATLDHLQDPLKADLQYHRGIVKTNARITADDWYQDVRHIELEFEDNVQ
jgi:sulfite reductase alpha subunit-like flavoprotein